MGVALVVLTTTTAILGPWLAPHAPDVQHRDTLLDAHGLPAAPGHVATHLLGGDAMGRDELSRLLHGGAVSLMVAFFATALAVLIGVSVGVTSGYFGGPFDFLAMRGVDVLLSIPFLLLAIAVRRVWEDPGLWTMFFVLGGLTWTGLARVTRAKVLQVRELEYIEAARALGMSPWRIVWRHVLPNVLGPIIVLGTTLIAHMIIFESAMSYLGLGVAPPTASWGSMLREGQTLLDIAPRLMLFPSAFIVATVFGFNLVGEGLRDAFDPKD